MRPTAWRACCGPSSRAPGEPNGGPVPRTLRQDRLRVAVDVLVSEGFGEVKVLALGQRLGVSRSSFHWSFRERQDLLDHRNAASAAFVCQAGMEAPTITAAVWDVFRLFVDLGLFGPRLDFAVRDWARRDGSVRRTLDAADAARLGALAARFEWHGYGTEEAETRARVLYWMQAGYYALDLREPLEGRLARVPGYLPGREAAPGEVEAFARRAREKGRGR